MGQKTDSHHGKDHAQDGADPIPNWPAGGDGIKFNSGTYGPSNVGDWLDVETTTRTGEFQVKFEVGSGRGFEVISTTSANPLFALTDLHSGATTALVIDLDTSASGTGVEAFQMSAIGGGGGSVQGASWTVEGSGGGGIGGLDMFVQQASGSAAVHGINLEITAASGAIVNGLEVAATSGTNNVSGLVVGAESGTAASACYGAQITADGTAGTPATVIGMSLGGYGGSDPYALKTDGGSVEVHLRTGETLVVQDNSGDPIFQIDEDGDIHILTGKTITADL